MNARATLKVLATAVGLLALNATAAIALPQLTGETGNRQCRQAYRLATSVFHSSEVSTTGPISAPDDLGSSPSLYTTEEDISGGSALSNDSDSFTNVAPPVTDTQPLHALFWQIAPQSGKRLVVADQPVNWEGDWYSVYFVDKAVKPQDVMDDIRQQQPDHRFKPILDDSWQPPLVLTDDDSDESWFIDLAAGGGAFPKWSIFAGDDMQLRCSVTFMPVVKQSVSLMPIAVRRFAASLNEALGPGADEGTLHPTARIRNAVDETWANAALRPWALNEKPYNSDKDIELGLQKWSKGSPKRLAVCHAIARGFPEAENSLAFYYRTTFHLQPRQAREMAAYAADILLRQYFSFHSVVASKPLSNPWTDLNASADATGKNNELRRAPFSCDPPIPATVAVANFESAVNVNPAEGGLVSDEGGNLYGTTMTGDGRSDNAVFELVKPTSGNGRWKEKILYSFGSSNDVRPEAGILRDRTGVLYGTTSHGGTHDKGVVFQLVPPKTANDTWTETTLYNFGGGLDGQEPHARLLLGQDGALYGTTYNGGGNRNCMFGCGNVFMLKKDSTGQWNEIILHTFAEQQDGSHPVYRLTMDRQGDLFGTTLHGGSDDPACATGVDHGCGIVFELVPAQGTWQEKVIYVFPSGKGGSAPTSALSMDARGNLYGTAMPERSGAGGVVYELAPSGTSYTFSVLHKFDAIDQYYFANIGSGGDQTRFGPFGDVLILPDGDLLGTGTEYPGTAYLFRLERPIGQEREWHEALLENYFSDDDSPVRLTSLAAGYGGTYYGIRMRTDNAAFGVAYKFRRNLSARSADKTLH